MQRVVLFDIDKTIFDRERYMSDFYNNLVSVLDLCGADISVVKNIYELNKKEYGFFEPNKFVKQIEKKYPATKGNLNVFFETVYLSKYLFKDSDIIKKIKNARIGIFSKGDFEFQKRKISRFKNILDENLIFIFEHKINKINFVLNNLKEAQVFIVEDDANILKEFKKADKNVKTIFIDRENEVKIESGTVDFKLESLFDIISVLNEKNT